MKKVLKPKIEKALIYIELALAIFVSMIYDFELSAIPFLLVIGSVLIGNLIILERWGRTWNQ